MRKSLLRLAQLNGETMNTKAGVKCERFEEPRRKRMHPTVVPIVCVLIGAAALFWTYNHVSGNCLELSDLFSYCEFHTIK